MFKTFKDGLTYIRGSPVLLTVIVIVCTFGALGMAHNQIVPAMSKDVMGTGAAGAAIAGGGLTKAAADSSIHLTERPLS